MIGIRAAVPEDAEAIAAVTEAGWRAGYREIVPGHYMERLPVSRWRREVREGLEAPVADNFTIVAEVDGSFAGYCFVAAPGREEPAGSSVAELAGLYVDPAQWRRGVARRLLEAALAGAADRGYEEMLLWSFADNERALSVYEAAGFELDGATRAFEPLGVQTLRMRRSLGA